MKVPDIYATNSNSNNNNNYEISVAFTSKILFVLELSCCSKVSCTSDRFGCRMPIMNSTKQTVGIIVWIYIYIYIITEQQNRFKYSKKSLKIQEFAWMLGLKPETLTGPMNNPEREILQKIFTTFIIYVVDTSRTVLKPDGPFVLKHELLYSLFDRIHVFGISGYIEAKYRLPPSVFQLQFFYVGSILFEDYE
jgi:hypothetical protein